MMKVNVGDHNKLARGLEDASIDLIFTDPPYPKKFEKVYRQMAKYAKRVLKPGGSLVTLCGQYQILRVGGWLEKAGLPLHWMGWMRQPANTTLFGKRVVCTGKPILWHSNGPPKIVYGFWWDSYYQGVREKAFHKWQQSLGWAYHTIKILTKEGDTVLDPFCGGGTVACACIALNRKCITFEIDKNTAAMAQKRIDSFYAAGLLTEEYDSGATTEMPEDYQLLEKKWIQMELFNPYALSGAQLESQTGSDLQTEDASSSLALPYQMIDSVEDSSGTSSPT